MADLNRPVDVSYDDGQPGVSAVAHNYCERGWCLLPTRISPAYLDPIRQSVAKISTQDRPEVVFEEGTRTVRAIHGCHRFDEACARLIHHASLVEAAEMLVEDEVYVYQFKVNMKRPLEGARWPWHQDFSFWHREDGMAAPNAVTLAIPLDDVFEHNGPVVVIPGSHSLGLLDGGGAGGGDWRNHVAANLSYTVDDAVADDLMKELGSIRLTGEIGSIFAFHPSIVHASSSNSSPDPRALILITYNAVSNAPQSITRPPFLVERDSTPLRRKTYEGIVQ